MPANDYYRQSHAYWKFLYLANGMNPKDAALLKYKNIEDGFIVFERAKTIRTGRADPRIISVYVTEETKEILEYLGTDNKEPNNYIFPILNKYMNPLLQHETIHLFIALIN